MPEGVGMNVGQIILGTEAIQPRRNAVRVHPGAVVPYKHIGGACPTVSVQLLTLHCRRTVKVCGAILMARTAPVLVVSS